MSIYLGKREVRLMQLGRGTPRRHRRLGAGCRSDVLRDLIEYHSAAIAATRICAIWPVTLTKSRAFNPKAIAPDRGDALKGIATGAMPSP